MSRRKPKAISGPVRKPKAGVWGPPGLKAARPYWRQALLLALVGVGAFAVTFALVRWGGRGNAPEEALAGMVWLPGGEFTMGTDADLGWPDEKPAHRVRVGGFWMDQ